MQNSVVLINLSVGAGYTGVNHGLAFLAPCVTKNDFKVFGLNIYNEISEDEFVDKIKTLDPILVGYSCTSPQIGSLKKYSHALRKYSNVLQIAGGVGPTLEPDRFLSESAVDGVCLGEGEVPLDNLLGTIKRNTSPFNTDGFYWRVDGKIEKKPVCQYVLDLSRLDFPDYTIYDNEIVCTRRPATDLITEEPSIPVILSRGCPNNCSYCCAPLLKKIYDNQSGYLRVPSVDYSIALIQKLLMTYPKARFISFFDDLMISNKKWLTRFALEYGKKINLPCSLPVRAENIDREVIESLIAMRCGMALIGLESGNEVFRKNYLNRKYSNKTFVEACALLTEAGIKIYTFNMVGFPFETRLEMEDTYNLNKEIDPVFGVCSFFMPFRNTKLFNICKENDLLLGQEEMDQISNYLTRPAIKMTPEQKQDCIDFHEKINAFLKQQRNKAIKKTSAG